jgi:hypothetical protein
MKLNELKQLIENTLAKEVKKAILESTEEVYVIKNKEGEPIEMCATQEEADEKLDSYQKSGKEFIIEKEPKPSIDELDKMGENLENMETEKQPMEGNEFTGALKAAKDAGEKTFTVDGKEYDVEECWSKQMEEELVGGQKKLDKNHNGKIDKEDFKILKGEKSSETNEDECMECGSNMEEGDKALDFSKYKFLKNINPKTSKDKKPEEHKESMGDSEDKYSFNKLKFEPKSEEGEVSEDDAQMCSECGSQMYEGVCNECGGAMNESKKRKVKLTESELVEFINKIVKESVPGLRIATDMKTKSGKINTDANKETGDKIKKSLDFDNNNNPEFPNQLGKEKEKAARTNSEDENEYVEDWRGGTMLDLKYDSEPSDQFKDRLKKALEGDKTTGNAQDGDVANVIKSDLGKKIAKAVDRKKENVKKMPLYKKDIQPSKETTVVNESLKTKSVLNEEIKRMKDMVQYNKKTQ